MVEESEIFWDNYSKKQQKPREFNSTEHRANMMASDERNDIMGVKQNVMKMRAEHLQWVHKLTTFEGLMNKGYKDLAEDVKEFRNFMDLMLKQLDERMDGLEERIKQRERPPNPVAVYCEERSRNTTTSSPSRVFSNNREKEDIDSDNEQIGLANLPDGTET